MSLSNQIYHLVEGDVDFDEIDDLIETYKITMIKEDVEDLLSIVSKTINDWNRDEKYDDSEVLKVVESAIKEGIINIKSYY